MSHKISVAAPARLLVEVSDDEGSSSSEFAFTDNDGVRAYGAAGDTHSSVLLVYLADERRWSCASAWQSNAYKLWKQSGVQKPVHGMAQQYGAAHSQKLLYDKYGVQVGSTHGELCVRGRRDDQSWGPWYVLRELDMPKPSHELSKFLNDAPDLQ